MAERRMFSKKIIDTDAFLAMPLSTQCLYFHLSMRADDEGFVGSPKTIQRSIGATDDDMRILLAKRYILDFPSGIVVIKHWFIHNYIQSDRAKETTYLEEKNTLALDEKKAYIESGNAVCIQNVSIDKYSIDKYSIDKYSIDKYSIDKYSIDKYSIDKESIDKESVGEEKPTAKRFVRPTVEQIAAYCKERNNNINAQRFYDFYESKGWKVGNQSMKDWKACVRTWEQRDNNDGKPAVIDEKPAAIGGKPAVIGGKNVNRHEYTDDDFKSMFTELRDE